MGKKDGITRRDFLKMTAASTAGMAVAAAASADSGGENKAVKDRNSQMAFSGEPYELLGKRLVFTNWMFVRPGTFAWVNAEGKNVSVVGNEPPGSAKFAPWEHPSGIRIRARKPERRIGHIFKAEKPWESDNPGWAASTISKERETYKAWGGAYYLESKDAMKWVRPEINTQEIAGHKNTNRMNMDVTGGTVFVDPSAPPSERYKWVGGGDITEDQYEAWKKKHPDRWEPRAWRQDMKRVLCISGAVSTDGFDWRRLPDPLVVEHSDTHLVAYYDTRLGKYVIFTRNYMIGPQANNHGGDAFHSWWTEGRRSVGRTESDDFREFPVSSVILEPNPDMPPSDLLYTNCYTTIPGAPDLHLMFPAVWHSSESDSTSIQIASSSDGRVWNYIPGGPVFGTAPAGEWDGGCVFSVPNLIELPNGDFALPYNGYNVPHKYPRGQWKMGVGYVVWPKGRIVALEAPARGEFSMNAFVPPGRKLLMNAVAEPGGSISTEVTDIDRKTLPGRSFADCDGIKGDSFRKVVTWKGSDDLGFKPGEAIALRFKLEAAAIYALEFE